MSQATESCQAHLFIPSYARLFHVIGDDNVTGPNIKLPLAKADHTTDNAAAMNADPHVHIHLVILSNLIEN